MQAIAETCRGTKYELPIMLAICLGLRASEIRGLRWSDIDGEYVNIHTAIVEGENGAAEKGPKSYSGARRGAPPRLPARSARPYPADR